MAPHCLCSTSEIGKPVDWSYLTRVVLPSGFLNTISWISQSTPGDAAAVRIAATYLDPEGAAACESAASLLPLEGAATGEGARPLLPAADEGAGAEASGAI